MSDRRGGEVDAVLARAKIAGAVASGGAIDVSAWVGQYPFRGIPKSSVADLKRRMSSLRISLAIVSPFEAIFWENGLDAYERAADELAADDASLQVWPVMRPGAMHGLERLLDRYHPRGLRLLPSYHDYHLYDASVEPIMTLARERRMIVQIFARIADERWHWMLKVPELPLHDIEYATGVFDRQPILVCGLNRPQALAARMEHHPMLYADVSRVRGPVFAMDQLLASPQIDRLVFGSLWPIQIVEATLWQITSAGATDEAARAKLLRENAEALLESCPKAQS